jgi:hypothetical protein
VLGEFGWVRDGFALQYPADVVGGHLDGAVRGGLNHGEEGRLGVGGVRQQRHGLALGVVAVTGESAGHPCGCLQWHSLRSVSADKRVAERGPESGRVGTLKRLPAK